MTIFNYFLNSTGLTDISVDVPSGTVEMAELLFEEAELGSHHIACLEGYLPDTRFKMEDAYTRFEAGVVEKGYVCDVFVLGISEKIGMHSTDYSELLPGIHDAQEKVYAIKNNNLF